MIPEINEPMIIPIFAIIRLFGSIKAKLAMNKDIVNPIPPGMIYLPEISTENHYVEMLFSIDGGKTYQIPPIQNTVITENGNTELQDVPTRLYTHIQWLLKKPLLPKETQKFYFKVRVPK